MNPTLDELVRGLGARIEGSGDTPIADICYDSRRAVPGCLFVALRGARTDGHRYLREAIAAGAAAVLVEQVSGGTAHVPTGLLRDTRAALPEIAARFFGHPGRDLTLVAVTGTNGKTSTVRLIESILLAAGRTAGSIGTISTRGPGFDEPSSLTTPESVDLQRSLARLRDCGCDAVALEASSHGLAQGRLRTLHFAAAVFTHLTLDHLDFHRDMDDYAAAKAELFGPEYLAGSAVLNVRDPLSERLARRARSGGRPVLTFGRGAECGADVRTIRESADLDGARLRIASGEDEVEISLPLPGDFQIENALAAVAAARSLGLDWAQIRRGIAATPPVPGRLERVAPGEPVVLVDYAHTPDALDRLLGRVRPTVRGSLISVFGCGGDRDKTKRAPMARAACAHSDWVIATSDNPRSEDPESILRDIAAGLSGGHEIVVDRREAIRRAIRRAQVDDVVIITGKGHEVEQILASGSVPFDDRVEARLALAEREGAG